MIAVGVFDQVADGLATPATGHVFIRGIPHKPGIGQRFAGAACGSVPAAAGPAGNEKVNAVQHLVIICQRWAAKAHRGHGSGHQGAAAQFESRHLYWDHGPIVAVNAHSGDPHFEPSEENHSPIQKGDEFLSSVTARLKGEFEVNLDIREDYSYIGEYYRSYISIAKKHVDDLEIALSYNTTKKDRSTIIFCANWKVYKLTELLSFKAAAEAPPPPPRLPDSK